MASAGRVQILLTCAKAQERHAMLSDGFSIGYFRLGTRLLVPVLAIPFLYTIVCTKCMPQLFFFSPEVKLHPMKTNFVILLQF